MHQPLTNHGAHGAEGGADGELVTGLAGLWSTYLWPRSGTSKLPLLGALKVLQG